MGVTSIISAADLEKALEIMPDRVGDFAEMLSYAGFDPAVTFNIIMRKMDVSPVAKRALFTLVIFGLTRGFGSTKSQETICQKTEKAGEGMLREAFTSLGITFGRPSSKTDITIPRIMAAFPFLTYRVQQDLILLGKNRRMGYMGKLPESLQYPGSVAMLNPESYKFHREDYIEYNMHCQSIWDNNYNEVRARENATKFADLAKDSKLAGKKKI